MQESCTKSLCSKVLKKNHSNLIFTVYSFVYSDFFRQYAFLSLYILTFLFTMAMDYL